MLIALKKTTDQKFPPVDKVRVQKSATFLNEEEISVLVDMLNQVRDDKSEQSYQESAAQLVSDYTTQSWLSRPVVPDSFRQKIHGAMDLHRGKANAPIQLVVFSDFSCFYCGKFVDMIKPLEKRYSDNLNIVFKHSPYSDESILASEAAQCAADQKRFWDYHDALFVTQDFSTDNLKTIALQLHLDQHKFDLCLQQKKHQARIMADMEESQRLGINGTPALFINGIKLDGLPEFDTLIQLIDSEVQNS